MGFHGRQRARRKRRLNALVVPIPLDQLAKGAWAMMARTLAEASQVLGLASRACCERQLWTVGNPDALGMAHEIEGAIEIDAGALVALFAVVLETAEQRISRTES